MLIFVFRFLFRAACLPSVSRDEKDQAPAPRARLEAVRFWLVYSLNTTHVAGVRLS